MSKINKIECLSKNCTNKAQNIKSLFSFCIKHNKQFKDITKHYNITEKDLNIE